MLNKYLIFSIFSAVELQKFWYGKEDPQSAENNILKTHPWLAHLVLLPDYEIQEEGFISEWKFKVSWYGNLFISIWRNAGLDKLRFIGQIHKLVKRSDVGSVMTVSGAKEKSFKVEKGDLIAIGHWGRTKHSIIPLTFGKCTKRVKLIHTRLILSLMGTKTTLSFNPVPGDNGCRTYELGIQVIRPKNAHWGEKVPRWGITAHNWVTNFHSHNYESCLVLCMVEKGFDCKGIDDRTGDCHLNNVTLQEAKDLGMWSGKWRTYTYQELIFQGGSVKPPPNPIEEKCENTESLGPIAKLNPDNAILSRQLQIYILSPFKCSGLITEWEFFVKIPGIVYLSVWRKRDNSWILIGKNKIEAAASGKQKIKISDNSQIKAKEGDVIGVFYDNDPNSNEGVISYVQKSDDNVNLCCSLKLEDLVPIHTADIFSDKVENYQAPETPDPVISRSIAIKAYLFPIAEYSALFPLDECHINDDDEITDVTTNNNVGKPNNIQFVEGPNGNKFGASYFSGTVDNFINVEGSQSLDTKTGITLMVNIYAETRTGVIAKYTEGPNGGIELLIRFGKIFFRLVERGKEYGSNEFIISKKVVSQKTWTHVTATYEPVSKTGTVYIDGIKDSSLTFKTERELATEGNIRLGAYPGDTRYFAGRMACLRVWNSALNDEAIVKEKKCKVRK